jgi:hypothetical protein
MQTPEEFMLEYRREQTELLKRQLEDFAPFRRKFYTDTCALGRRRSEKLQELLKASEEIVQVLTFDQRAEIITVSSDDAGTTARLRYRLQASRDKWLIQDVDLECPHCKGTTGHSHCDICSGNGWWPFLNEMQNRQLDYLPKSNRPPPPPPHRRY